MSDLRINHDRRVADVQTVYDPVNGNFNTLFATATPLVNTLYDGSGHPPLKRPKGDPFLVQNIFTDFKRHDLGSNFYERNYDGTIQRQFMTRALWGIGTKSSLGHDGRSISLDEVILRHGGEAQAFTRCVCEAGGAGFGCAAEIPEVADSVSTERHCLQPRSGQSEYARFPAVRAWQHQVDRAV
jgi:hypothetical protein